MSAPVVDAPRLGERILLTRTVAELPTWVRDMLLDFGATDCCQANKPRQYLVKWDGRQLTVWETNQVGGTHFR